MISNSELSLNERKLNIVQRQMESIRAEEYKVLLTKRLAEHKDKISKLKVGSIKQYQIVYLDELRELVRFCEEQEIPFYIIRISDRFIDQWTTLDQVKHYFQWRERPKVASGVKIYLRVHKGYVTKWDITNPPQYCIGLAAWSFLRY